jgi:hypothetical protein
MQYEGNDRPSNIFPTLAQLQHQQANYEYYLAKLTQARREADEAQAALDAKIAQFRAEGISVSTPETEDCQDNCDSWDYPN